MYRWYQRSSRCFVYLSDVSPGDNPFDRNSAFRGSRWFTRGWTLQELLAPRTIYFYDNSWNLILRKTFGEQGPVIVLLSEASRIDEANFRPP